MGFVEPVYQELLRMKTAHENAVHEDTPSTLVAEHYAVKRFLEAVALHRGAAVVNEEASVERRLAHLEAKLCMPSGREDIRDALRTVYRDGRDAFVPCDECAVIQSNDASRHFHGCSKREPLSADAWEALNRSCELGRDVAVAPRVVHFVVPQPASGCTQCKDTGVLLDGAACPGCMRGYAEYQKRYPNIEDAAQVKKERDDVALADLSASENDGCPVGEDELRMLSGHFDAWLVVQVRAQRSDLRALKERVDKCAVGDAVSRLFSDVFMRLGELERGGRPPMALTDHGLKVSGYVCGTCRMIPCSCKPAEPSTICSTESQKR